MIELFFVIANCALILILLVFIIRRKNSHDQSDLLTQLVGVEKGIDRVGQSIRDEMATTRQEAKQESRSQREEAANALKGFGDSVFKVVSESAGSQKSDMTSMADSLQLQISNIAGLINAQLQNVSGQLTSLTDSNEQKLTLIRGTVDSRLQSLQTDNAARLDQIRDESKQNSRAQRDEVNSSLKNFNESLLRGLSDMADNQRSQSLSVSRALETGLTTMRGTVETKLNQIQEGNAQKLEEMRVTVDEKLHGTLETRLGEAFNLVTSQLEQVHKGLGEMQNLAVGVGDLKRALTNVKTRGGWAEVQLGALLEDMLAPSQYDRNFKPRETGDAKVEYAIKLPNRDADAGYVWLPIDSKFPIEDYNRLVEAQERGDQAAINMATRAVEVRIKNSAKDIAQKYLNPPRTTDFGLMFLPTEGLYAEVMRRSGLIETLRREYKVAVVGPSTCAAFINSLQMGFRTLAIQERSNEVWKILAATKTEFGKFGLVLDCVKKKLEQATNTMDTVAVRSRAIERKLRDVEELPTSDFIIVESEIGSGETEEAA